MKIHWSPLKFEKDLSEELRLKDIQIIKQFERLFLVKDHDHNLVWSENNWANAQSFKFNSITEAAKKLKSSGGFACLHSVSHHRRAELIKEKLVNLKEKPLDFFPKLEPKKILNWALVAENEIYFSREEAALPFPRGEVVFNEDKDAPSRAYLKLWEAFTRLQTHPSKNQKCIDLGASPGGWSYVLTKFGCDVVAVDKAKMHPGLLKLHNFEHLKKDAFTMEPTRADWLFSDIICYPDKLFDLVNKWVGTGLVKNFVITIKFQGKTDFEALKKFESIVGSRTMHLHNNKHEVTWTLLS